MNKDFLSQEEIDALLSGGAPKQGINPDDYLTMFDRDALGEVGNISFGTAATTLSTLLRQKVNITTPTVTVMRPEDFVHEIPEAHIAARVSYTEGLEGSNVFVIRMRDAQIIADLMLGGDGSAPATELNELHISAVAEAMNQMMGSASTSMSSMLARTVNISPPSVEVVPSGGTEEELVPLRSEVIVKISFRLQVGDLIDSNIMQIVPLDFAQSLVGVLMGSATPAAEQPPSAKPTSAKPVEAPVAVAPSPVAVGSSGPDYYSGSAAIREDPYVAPPRVPEPSPKAPPPMVEKAAFSSFDETPVHHGGRNLDLLLDIPLGITVELGRTKKLIRDVLDLAPGSILELDTLAGEPVAILVNNKLIARGEVVVIDENFGVRVTDIVSPTERIKRLQ